MAARKKDISLSDIAIWQTDTKPRIRDLLKRLMMSLKDMNGMDAGETSEQQSGSVGPLDNSGGVSAFWFLVW